MDVYIVIYNQSDKYGFGGPLRVLWKTTPHVARLVCSDQRTCGDKHFLGWTYVNGQEVQRVQDDGRYDHVLESLGVSKDFSGDIPRLLL